MNAAIAQHLNILESAIVKVEEWANVLFVVAKGIGARFVSKKVVKVEVKTLKTVKRTSASGMVCWDKGRKFKEGGSVWETISTKNTRIYWDSNVEDEIAEWEIEAVFVSAA